MLLSIWRSVYSKLIDTVDIHKRAIIIATEERGKKFINEMVSIKSSGYQIVKAFLFENDQFKSFVLPEWQLVEEPLDSIVQSRNYDLIAIDPLLNNLTDFNIKNILESKYAGKLIYDLPSLYKNITGRIPLAYIDGLWLLSDEGMQRGTKTYLKIRRLFDFLFSSIVVLVLFPLFITISLLIKLDSKGPIIYRQKRLGFRHSTFDCYKFRTMVQDAESNGPVWAQKNDSRVTRVGRFLRKSRLDELPQLWNILKGDISFIGPRPIREVFAKEFASQYPFYDLRFSVKPGLSGWAQIHGCYAVPSGLEALQYELFYIQNVSLFLDVYIFIKTIQIIIWGRGR